jgi:DNA-binding transcriptional ArsR family regulator
MSDQSAAREAVFDALGHPMRRRMLELLREGPRPVGELARELPIKRPAVSKHLRVLEGAGLVEHRSRGTRNLYVVAPEGYQHAQRWLTDVWDAALSEFAAYVEGRVKPAGHSDRTGDAANEDQAEQGDDDHD